MHHNFIQNFETIRERNQYGNEYIVEAIAKSSSTYRPWRVFTFEWYDNTRKQILEPQSNLTYDEYDNIENEPGYRHGSVPSETKLLEFILESVRTDLEYEDAVIRHNDTFCGGTGQALPSKREKLETWNGDFEHESISAIRHNSGQLKIFRAIDQTMPYRTSSVTFSFVFAEQLADWIEDRDTECVFENEEIKAAGAYNRIGDGIAVYSQRFANDISQLSMSNSEADELVKFIHKTNNLHQFLAYQYTFARDESSFKTDFSDYLNRDEISLQEITQFAEPTVEQITEI